MRYTHFCIVQNAEQLGTVAVMEQAINAAKGYAKKNRAQVSVIGHRDDGKEKEVIYHPDGSIEKIWEIGYRRRLI